MDCFYIITNKLKDKDYAITSQIEQYIQSSGKKCFLSEKDSEGHIIPGTVPKEAECGLVLGGDGTLTVRSEILESEAFRCLGSILERSDILQMWIWKILKVHWIICFQRLRLLKNG